MSWKSLTCVTVFCALLVGQAQAAPTLSVAGSADGANTLWTVSITPDAALLPGSMAVELSFEFPTTQGFVGFAVDGNWNENINGTVIENPGQNPYTGGVTDFVESHPNVASQLGGAGNVNAIFASLGSTLYPTGTTTPQTVLTFTTAGTSGTVNWGGFIAQDPGPNAPFFDVSGTATFPDSPIFIPGDFNGSGQVEAGDLNLVLDNWGQVTPPIPAMWTGDQPNGLIEAGELNAVLDNWGNVASGALTVSASVVPEPASIASLLGFAGLGVLMLRNRKSA